MYQTYMGKTETVFSKDIMSFFKTGMNKHMQMFHKKLT